MKSERRNQDRPNDSSNLDALTKSSLNTVVSQAYPEPLPLPTVDFEALCIIGELGATTVL